MPEDAFDDAGGSDTFVLLDEELSDPAIIPRPPTPEEELDDDGGSLEIEEPDDSEDELFEDELDDALLWSVLRDEVPLELNNPTLIVVSIRGLKSRDSATS